MNKVLKLSVVMLFSLIIIIACSMPKSNESGGTVPGESRAAADPAIDMAIGFFHFNYCGTGQTVSWRGDCHMNDAVVGGYHDAGDHVKFGLPAAFSATMLAWADYEYDISAGPEIKRFMDYFMQLGTTNFIYQIGDPGADHAYWGSPEDDPNARPVYRSSQASCVQAGTAAALAAGYITGNGGNLDRAIALFNAAEAAKSDAGYTAANGFYTSNSGFYDELAWAAIWIYLATDDKTYLDKAETYIAQTDWDDYKWTYCWDDAKTAAIMKLAMITGKSKYITQVERQLDWWLPGGGITYTPGGLPWLDQWGVLRYASAQAFLAKLWADYPLGDESKKSAYRDFSSNIISYIKGNNPRNGSYIIGYGSNWPQCPHHRAASPDKTCPAPHELTGALVGGPDQSDNYNDSTDNYTQSEVALDYNACLVAALVSVNSPRVSPTYPLPTPPPSGGPGNGNGLSGEYYDNISLSGTPVLTRTDAEVDFNWGGGSPSSSIPADSFSVRWTGKIEAQMSETYTFYTLTDDGARLWVNGQLVIDDWNDHAATTEYEASGSIVLQMGQQYDIVMEYFENGGDSSAQLFWSNPWQEKQIIPQTQLYAEGGTTPTPTPTATPTPTPTATPTPTPTATPTTTPTPTPTPTATPTPTPTATPTPTVTPTGDYTSITLPLTYDGAGEFYWKTGDFSTSQSDWSRFINSWNCDLLEINGVDCTNSWTAEHQIPPADDGYWYIHYKASFGWSHLEIK